MSWVEWVLNETTWIDCFTDVFFVDDWNWQNFVLCSPSVKSVSVALVGMCFVLWQSWTWKGIETFAVNLGFSEDSFNFLQFFQCVEINKSWSDVNSDEQVSMNGPWMVEIVDPFGTSLWIRSSIVLTLMTNFVPFVHLRDAEVKFPCARAVTLGDFEKELIWCREDWDYQRTLLISYSLWTT